MVLEECPVQGADLKQTESRLTPYIINMALLFIYLLR